MSHRLQHFFRFAATAIALASVVGSARADSQTVVQSTNFGTLNLPFTQNFGLSIGPLAADDTFLADYGFALQSNSSLSSAVVTIDLGKTYDISNLSVTLLKGTAWAGPVPSDLDSAQIADRDSRIIVTGTGSSMTQSIDEVPLAPGNYVMEIAGKATGSSGGTYAGVLNVAALPEPTGLVLSACGLGLLALTRRHSGR